jgi:hypothetical protein
MWICETCGQPCDDKDKTCSMCTSERPKQTVKKAAAKTATKTFEFNEDAKTPAKPKAEPEPEPEPEPEVKPKSKPEMAEKTKTLESSETIETVPATDDSEDISMDSTSTVEVGERPIIVIARKLSRTPRFWMIFGAVVLGFVIIPWSVSMIAKLAKGPELDYNANVVEPEVKKKLDVIIEDIMPDKLEWAQELLRNRLPTRFPEELTMDINKAEAEVRYEGKGKTSAFYRMLVSYHFTDAHKKTYFWQPVTFFFEVRNGTWTMIGDKWIRASEMIFE